jgi:rod shape-determining protein MreC
MESILGRYRNLVILVGVLFLQVLGLAVQVKRANSDARDTRLIRIWVVGAITPFERGLVWIENSTGNLWHNYVYLRGVRAENRQLKEQIEQMRIEQVRLSEDAAQARRLQALLAFKEQYVSKTLAAQVIGSSGSDFSHVVFIDKGENAGVKPDMAVITADGVVGKVWDVYPSVAKVLLINDQSSGVGVVLEKSRVHGVLRGTPNGEVTLERIMTDEQVPIGETLLTSGGDRIFPEGLPVGMISNVGNGKDLFLNIRVKPTADLSKLEEVLVVLEKQDRQATADDSSRVRAADILAARLPTVPTKPPADSSPAKSPAQPGVVEDLHQNPNQTPNQTPNPQVQRTAVPAPGTQKAATQNPGAQNPATLKPAGTGVAASDPTKPSVTQKPPKTTPAQPVPPPPSPQPAADGGGPQ